MANSKKKSAKKPADSARKPATRRAATKAASRRPKPVASKPVTARPEVSRAVSKRTVRSSESPKLIARPAVARPPVAGPPVAGPPVARPPASRRPVRPSTASAQPVPASRSPAQRPISRPPEPPPAVPPPKPVKVHSGLNAKDLETFRGLLLAKRAEILGNVNAMRDEAAGVGSGDRSELSSMPLHMADLGTDHFERELTLGLLEGERSLLRDIDQALDRIRERTYGLCLATGKPIGKARLKAQPWAKHCMEYMLLQESGRRFRY